MARTLVDTSAWIDFFRNGKSAESQLLENLLKIDGVCLTPLIRAELLSGARHEKEYVALSSTLAALTVLTEPLDLWESVARHRFHLARRGIQTSLVDLSIAVYAAFHECSLLTKDRIFFRINKFVPFKLIQI